jgi:hypothetical protein
MTRLNAASCATALVEAVITPQGRPKPANVVTVAAVLPGQTPTPPMASRVQQCPHHPRFKPFRSHQRAISAHPYYSCSSSTNAMQFDVELGHANPLRKGADRADPLAATHPPAAIVENWPVRLPQRR